MARPELSFYTPLDPSGSMDQNNTLSQGSGKDLPTASENRPPQRILLTRTMFPQDSVGYAVFPDDLEGRMRLETILAQPLTGIFKPENKVLIPLFETGIKSLAAFLGTTHDKFNALVPAKASQHIRKQLRKHLESYTITSQAYLLKDILGPYEELYAIPPDREQELIDVVENSVDKLKQSDQYNLRDYEALVDRYGLNTDIKTTLKEIADAGGVTKQNINRRIQRIIKILRQPYYRILRGYRSLSPQSIGRKFTGFIFEKDLPKFYPYITSILSEATLRELQQSLLVLEYANFRDLMRFEIREDMPDLSQSAIEDIKRQIELAAKSKTEPNIL